jgi:hypothetical protein
MGLKILRKALVRKVSLGFDKAKRRTALLPDFDRSRIKFDHGINLTQNLGSKWNDFASRGGIETIKVKLNEMITKQCSRREGPKVLWMKTSGTIQKGSRNKSHGGLK